MDLPNATLRVKFLEPFKDGTIFGSTQFKTGQEVEITQNQYEQAKRSGAMIERIAIVIPPPDEPQQKGRSRGKA